ncbi:MULTISPECIES: ExbD/TolR family protein [Leptospira]|uniref:Biopolymer transporter ExbD n=5 Tax=Leptospira santarosai TaxID=28183 RepID=A0A0G8BIU9_9LEPT|nr:MULTISPECIES: biopolymer transporter ExbD [Leptospira]EMO58539.1 transport energizing protein, ExbD/TolR family [Leptospira santarosai str. CBC1416]ASV11775.1 biopolymer transporter ExbD [Leptospira santarosai]AVQ12015.1 Transport energizing protein, ExbD/TolR family [Leptospira santarosai]AVV49395.1 Transport energizing protein, ExbD/TolR family [Leptospira santarosai]AVV80404.1 Transport energizing protein, ExbD/TolR family [Leptospira santarosai]
MKFRKFRSSASRTGQIELAPLIDVISFIVIYFLMNATLEKSTVMKIELPRSSSTAQEKKKDELVITVNKDGKIFLDKDTDPVPLEKLTEKINIFLGPLEKREPGKNRVIIRGDGTASYQTVIKVIDKVNEAGVSKFNLAMVRQTGSGEK